MALLVTDCPHCNSSRSAMVIFGVKPFPKEKGIEKRQDDFRQPLLMWPLSVAATCQVCSKPVAAVLHTPFANRQSDYPTIAANSVKALLGEGEVTALGFKAFSKWPVAEPPSIPPHLPESVAKAFRSAESNYSLPDGEDAAAMLYRRSIDIAIREKHPEVKGLLAPRIAQLTKLGLLPPAMKEWADQIRLIGNDGAHEPEGVTRDDLVPMRGFTEAFLRYFISIPYEVSLRRGEIDVDGNPTTPPTDPA